MKWRAEVMGWSGVILVGLALACYDWRLSLLVLGLLLLGMSVVELMDGRGDLPDNQ